MPGEEEGRLAPSCMSVEGGWELVLSLRLAALLPQNLLSVVASVLHLGNVQFSADEQSNAQVVTENQIKYLARVSVEELAG